MTKKLKNNLYAKVTSAMSFALLGFFAPSIFAAGASDTESDLSVPTLDLSDSTESSYTLIPVDLTDVNSDGEYTGNERGFLVTKYLKESDGSYTEKYYLVDIENIALGSGNTLYFKWSEDSNGTFVLVSANESDADFSVSYDSSTKSRVSSTASITSNIIGASTTGSAYNNAMGGAFYSITSSTVSIDGDFINNYAKNSDGKYAYGGAIYSKNATISYIYGSFIGNYASATSSYAYGGAIYLYSGSIGEIIGDFIGNYASTTSNTVYGGAIYNASTIGNIDGDFIGNHVSSTSGDALGGAIYNYRGSTIGDITGDFIGNYATSNPDSGSSNAKAGAIYNDSTSTIGNITGDFIANSVYSGNSGAAGAAIYNLGEIGNITGDFIENTLIACLSTNYGALLNQGGTIGNITGDFIGNSISTDSTIGVASGSVSSRGTAIYNYNATIGYIVGDFIDNTTYLYNNTSYAQATGGAVYNSVASTTSYSGIDYIVGDFTNNTIVAKTDSITAPAKSDYETKAIGGAVYNLANTGSNVTSSAYIGYIEGDFTGNTATAISGGADHTTTAIGGAIYNASSMTTSSSSYISSTSAEIGYITGDFSENGVSAATYAAGGAIYNSAAITSSSAQDGVTSISKIGTITGDFTDNFAIATGGAAYGGAIYNTSSTESGNDVIFEATLSSIEGNITGNYASGTTEALGGAVYNSGSNSTVTFSSTSDNYSYLGNFATTQELSYDSEGKLETVLTSTDDKNGGFLYMDSSSVVFSTAVDTSITIGDGTVGYDSIAGTGTITKDGAGELIVNSSMEFYEGSLSVEEGEMTVNNILGATSITIDSGATLTIGISDYMYGTETTLLKNITSADSVSNSGTLNLVANASAVAGDYTVSASGVVSLSNVFGGTYNSDTGVFTVAEASSVVLNTSAELTVSASERVAVATSETNDRTAVYLAFSSDASSSGTDSAEITITSISENETFVSKYVSTLDTADSILASAAYDFEIDLESGSVMLSMYVGIEDYDVSQFTIYHSENGVDTWDTSSASNVTYDGTYVSFEVTGFSTYGYTVSAVSAAVPEPSTYAMIIGVLALAFAAYRRRK